MSRVYNFSPGPSILPESILQQAQAELLDYRGSGMSAMEISHQSSLFSEIVEKTEQLLRELLAIPKNYHVFFMQGGATAQFAMVPLNCLHGKKTADYVHTGTWSGKAMDEAKRYCDARMVVSGEASHFTDIADPSTWSLNSDAAYVHYTPNETIHGFEFLTMPDFGKVPVIADMSSTILSRPIDVSRFGIIYAGAQKNVGPSGLTIVIVRDDVIGEPLPFTPSLYRYRNYINNRSIFNTPPTFPWYMISLELAWLKAEGGLSIMQERNRRKSDRLYHFIDESDFYRNSVMKSYRSWMNVPFTLADPAKDTLFLEMAEANGLTNLRGHRSVGGMRASLYNAMPEAGVEALIEFMRDFEKRYA